ncbi:MAG: N-acetyl-gamma-glutamyl-phosphate reductase [Ruminococcaceae bacterium]|nr:N-acetyl-gamma-glutamyl-phosphate reductase [Oscillospiraceae bacterium]
MQKIKVFIDGSVGTTGLRIYDRLSVRQDIELIKLPEESRKDLASRVEAVKASDVTFLCLPDAASKEICEVVGDCDTKILDTSTAHRTNPAWVYGFPELSKDFRSKLLASNRIAVPGCHASGFCSIVAPLVANGIISPDYPVAATSITGYSGGGKKMIAEYDDNSRPDEFNAPRQYGITQKHKHLPEMKAICCLDYEPCFSPIVSDFYSGMTVTVPLFGRMLKKSMSLAEIHKFFEEHYKGQKLVKVLPFGYDGMIGSNHMSGKDSMELIITGNDERILIASCFDNLGKGASGAAVQCFNLITNSDETTGLEL